MAQPLIRITHQHALLFAAFLVLYEFLTYIANDMIMPGMIKVVESFHGPESAIATSLTAYIMGGASLQLFLGPISDRFGRRPVMLFGAVFFFICTLVIGCTHSIDGFLWARFFQGMGLCFIGVIGYATLQEIFAEMDAIRLIAVLANVALIAPLIGPSLGAVFILYFDWRFIFFIIAVFALAALWGLWQYMPEPVGQITRDGVQIKKIPLTPRVITKNYKQLLSNVPFMFGSIGLGLLALPCVAWIGLAPVILVNAAHLSIIDYALWQIPVFGALIVGNVVLHQLTHRYNVKKLTVLGSRITIIGLLACVLIPLLSTAHFGSLMPGLLVYFFGLGIAGAPLNRLILFMTPGGKGTTAAVISVISMLIQGLGIEVANHMYTSHHNLLFGLFCAVVGAIYFLFLWSMFRAMPLDIQDGELTNEF